MRGGFFRALGRCFAGDFGAAARREWAILPRNSGVFGLSEGAARRFSARRTVPGQLGEKIFKKGAKKGGKLKNWGARDAGRRSEGTLYRVRGVIFRSGNEASSSVARGALRAGASTTGARHEISEIRSSYIHRESASNPLRSPCGGISACPTRNFLTFTDRLRPPACRILITTISFQSRQETPCVRARHFEGTTANQYWTRFIRASRL